MEQLQIYSLIIIGSTAVARNSRSRILADVVNLSALVNNGRSWYKTQQQLTAASRSTWHPAQQQQEQHISSTAATSSSSQQQQSAALATSSSQERKPAVGASRIGQQQELLAARGNQHQPAEARQQPGSS